MSTRRYTHTQLFGGKHTLCRWGRLLRTITIAMWDWVRSRSGAHVYILSCLLGSATTIATQQTHSLPSQFAQYQGDIHINNSLWY